jgi:hypothetical protein
VREGWRGRDREFDGEREIYVEGERDKQREREGEGGDLDTITKDYLIPYVTHP